MKHGPIEPAPVGQASEVASSDNAAGGATPIHDKEMARRFLTTLDPNATRFTFQFFSDCGGRRAEIFHGTLDEVWPKVLALNAPQQGVGIFVTVRNGFPGPNCEKRRARSRAFWRCRWGGAGRALRSCVKRVRRRPKHGRP